MVCKAPSRACLTGLTVAFKPLAVSSSTLSWSMRLIELSFQVLDFQEQQAALRMHEDEVRITPPLSHRYVVEAQPVVVEQRLQAMR